MTKPDLDRLPWGVVAVAAIITWYLVIAVAGPVVVVVGGAALSFVFLWNYGVGLARTMLPELLGQSDSCLILPTPTAPENEPAYKQYFFGQALADYRQVVEMSLEADLRVASGPWCADLARWLLTGKSKNIHRREFSGTELVFSVPFGLLVLGVLVVSAVVAAAVAVAFGLVHLAVVCAAMAVSGVGAATFQGLETVSQLLRRIRMACPHAGCYRAIALPVYECPGTNCGRRHRQLRPGSYGVFVRTCICHQRLPTLLRLGRHGLTAYCPHCERPLPDRIGTARATHLPVVGGPSAGKTMLLMSAMVVLAEEAARGGLELTFASTADRAEFERARDQLRQNVDLPKTVVRPPRAFLVYVGSSGDRRLVYLYDAAGESTQSSEIAQQLSYLEHAEGLLFVVDPFSLPALTNNLDNDGRQIAAASGPSPENPDTTFTRISNVLRSMSKGGASSMPVAVVVTKGDALSRLSNVHAPSVGAEGDVVSKWLDHVGLDTMNRSLEVLFGAVSYWTVSARAAMHAGASGHAVSAPIRWLLAEAGLDLPTTTVTS